VLRLSGSEEADEATAPAQAGTLAHAALEAFYRRCDGHPPRAFDAAAERLFEEVSDEVFHQAEESDDVWLGSPALWQVTRERVRDELRAYLGWELPYMDEKGERPVRVELSFGDEASDAVRLAGDDVSGTRRLLLLRGRVDRVDRIGDGDAAVLRVLDYKRGRPPPRSGHADGSVLQTALYQAAVEAVVGEPVDAARYRSIRSPGSPADGALLKRENVPRTLAFAFAIPPRVRAGLFEAIQASAWRRVLPWQFDRTVTRTAGTLPSGSRFDTDDGADEGSDVDA
jgi:RecB family exonuclease